MAEAISQGRATTDPVVMAAQVPPLPFRRPGRGQPDRRPLRRADKKHNALARRLFDRQYDYLRFTRDWRTPLDNNGSERDIRMIKLRQKVSGCLRTLTGARQFCAIRSYLSIARQARAQLPRRPRDAHRKPALDTLRRRLTALGNPGT